MTKHLETGEWGEQMAMEYLVKIGYKIVLRNWRFTDFGEPYEFVDRKKQRLLIRAAQAYILKTGYVGEVRFDVVAITKSPKTALNHIKDAFWDS